MPLCDDLLALAKLKRTKVNFERVQEQLADLDLHSESAEDAESLLSTARDALEELAGGLNEDDNPLIPWAADAREKAQAFLDSCDISEESISELIGEASDIADEYEGAMEDPDYSADDREEVWGNLCNALENIASAVK